MWSPPQDGGTWLTRVVEMGPCEAASYGCCGNAAIVVYKQCFAHVLSELPAVTEEHGQCKAICGRKTEAKEGDALLQRLLP